MESYFVQQIFVTCLPFRPLVAVIVPDHEVLCWWAKENNLQHDFRPETLCRDPRVREAVLKDLEAVADQHKNVRLSSLLLLLPHHHHHHRHNLQLSAWEYVKAVHLEPSFFNVENQCITPTFTLRRQYLRERFEEQIIEMYRELSADIAVEQSGGGGSDDEYVGPMSLRHSLTLPTYTDTKKTPYLPTYHQEESSKSSPALAARSVLDSASSGDLGVDSSDSNGPIQYCTCASSSPSSSGDDAVATDGENETKGGATTKRMKMEEDDEGGAMMMRIPRASSITRTHVRRPSLTITRSSSAVNKDAMTVVQGLARRRTGMSSSLSSPSLTSLEVSALSSSSASNFISRLYCSKCGRRIMTTNPSSPSSSSSSSSTRDKSTDASGEDAVLGNTLPIGDMLLQEDDGEEDLPLEVERPMC